MPAKARACPHCDASLSPNLGRRLARLAAGGLAAVTLMACYGGPAYYDDCFDNDGDGWFPACYDEVCDPDLDPNCDCDDTSSSIHPGAPDSLGDGIDQDCSGADGPGKPRLDGGIDAEPDAGHDATIDATIDAIGDFDGV